MVFLPQATYGQLGTVAQPMQAPAQDVADPFVWGSGGRRMSPEDIAAEREIAASLMQNGMDFSPVGHWTQGLARVGQSLVGALQSSHADKAAEANKAYEDQIAQALLGGGDQASIAGRVLTDPNLANLQPVAKMIYERANPKATAPHYWETNAGDLGMVGPDGQPVILYKDPDLKVQMVPDGLGGFTPVPIQRSSAAMAPTAPLPTFTAEDWDKAPSAGGPTPQASGGF